MIHPVVGVDPEAAWKRLIRGQYHEIAGAVHTDLFHEPHAGFMAEKIKAML